MREGIFFSLAVAAGGAAGALRRAAGSRFVTAAAGGVFPLGILLVNGVGSLLMGLLLGLAARRGGGELWLALLGTGFLGGFTTFSSFALDSVRLWQTAGSDLAVLNLVLNAGLGMAAACLGWKAAHFGRGETA
ncbi:CrcB family protein [uncultured Mailhella sp.]|uniref:fluoride efflux transporter FluC n=1 Tax=uncultured Mailhella sp. TaxID=1981031 RepID=UPI002637DAF4|nr:CrcB family protein [uncultured Mailhella sp.]